MSLRKSLAPFVVVLASILLFSVNATQTRAQSQSEDANPNTPLYKTISIKPSTSSIHAARTTEIGPDGLTATNVTVQELIRSAYQVDDDQITSAPSWLSSHRYDIAAKVDTSAAGQGELVGERTRRGH